MTDELLPTTQSSKKRGYPAGVKRCTVVVPVPTEGAAEFAQVRCRRAAKFGDFCEDHKGMQEWLNPSVNHYDQATSTP